MTTVVISVSPDECGGMGSAEREAGLVEAYAVDLRDTDVPRELG